MAMVRAMVTTLLWPPVVTSCGGRLSTNLARLRPKSSCSSRSATSTSGSDELSQTPLRPYGALLLDIEGTLLETSQPVPEVYASIGAKYGVKATAADIKKGFKKAFSEPWPERLRYEGDGRPFWRYAVATATGCPDETYFEEFYQHFARGDAWKLANGAPEALTRLCNVGVKLAVVSNFDSRLRPILRDLQVDTLFDALIISAEIGYEKPSPEIFEAALNELCVDAKVAVHVGDDLANDKQGALAAGLESWYAQLIHFLCLVLLDILKSLQIAFCSLLLEQCGKGLCPTRFLSQPASTSQSWISTFLHFTCNYA